MPLEAVTFHNLDHVAEFGLLHRARAWAVHLQGAMAAPAMVVLEVDAKKSSQVSLTEDDDLVEALECVAPSSPGPRQAHPEEAIGDLDAGSCVAAMVDGELVT